MPQLTTGFLGTLCAATILGLLSTLACWMIQLPLNDFQIYPNKINRVIAYIPFLDRYLETQPSSWKAYVARARAHECLGENQLALTDYNSALTLVPHKVIVLKRRGFLRYRLGDYQGALADCNELFKDSCRKAPSYFFLRSSTLSQLHEYRQALADAEYLIRLQPCFSSAYLCRAYAHLGLHDFSGSLSDCAFAKKLLPSSTDWVLCSAEVYAAQHNWPAVVTACSNVLSINRTNVRANCLRSIAYNQLKRFNNAIDDATTAIFLNPATKEAYVVRAQAYCHVDRLDEAYYDALQAINIDPRLLKSKELQFVPNLKNQYAPHM
jgi:tetratricopeptide (TPR) repeat protein